MNHFSHHLQRTAVLAALLLIPAALSAAALADEPAHSLLLPLVITRPGLIVAGNEAQLRAAFASANAAGQMPRIELAADVALTAPLPMLDNPRGGTVVIAGNGRALNGGGNGPVLAFGPGTTAVVERLTVSGGSTADGCGGGIHTEGRLTLRRSRITGNAARRGGGICAVVNGEPAALKLEETTVARNTAEAGGGLFAVADKTPDAYDGPHLDVNVAGSLLEANTALSSGGGVYAASGADARLHLRFTGSTLAGNRAEGGSGGAIYSATADGFVTTMLTRSTVAYNTAAGAAGLHNQGATGIEWYEGGRATATVNNSTFSGNVSAGKGGAIGNFNVEAPFLLNRAGDALTPQVPPPIGGAYLDLSYSTLTGNRAAQGGGVWNDYNAALSGSIIAGNNAAGADCDGIGWTQSLGYNLDGDNSCDLDQPTDLPGGRAGLLPLALNPPGTTSTHALGPDSQARNRIPIGRAGCNPAADADQRGMARPQPASGLCDIGAYEAER